MLVTPNKDISPKLRTLIPVKKHLALLALGLGLVFSTPTSGNAADVDKTDNKAPILVSLQIEKSSLVLNEITRIKLIIRDDKNDIGGSIYIQFQSPNDAPGSLRPYVYFTASGKSYNSSIKENNYIEYTYLISVKAPEWPGAYTAFQIFMLEDSNGNKSAFYLNQKCRNVNDAANPQALAFPEVIPECNINFTVRDLTPAEKAVASEKAAQEKAAAEKAALEKAAAEKAALEKAAADRAAADKAAADKAAAAKGEVNKFKELIERIKNLKSRYPNNSQLTGMEVKAKILEGVLGKNLSSTIPNIESINLWLDANEIVWQKTQKQTINCIKGKTTKKVTAVKPKCPSGYKKK